jgi:hypothetical protein
MVILDIKSLEKLAKLNANIQHLIEQEKELDKTFRLSNRFNGVFGEAIGLTKLYQKYGDAADYEWKGQQKKGFDLLVTLIEKKQKIRFQIKTSSQEAYVFRVVKVKDLDSEKITGQLKSKDFTEISMRIKDAIEQAETDVWLLIHTNKDKQDFFWVTKENMAEVVINHYKKAVEYRKHGVNFHGYVKNNVYRPHIGQKEKWDRELLDKYKITSWDDVSVFS